MCLSRVTSPASSHVCVITPHLALLPNSHTAYFTSGNDCTFVWLVASSSHTMWFPDGRLHLPWGRNPWCLPFQLFIVFSVLSFTQQLNEVWILEICSLAGTMTEITTKQVTCTAKLLTLHIIHKGYLAGAGHKPARSYSFGQVCVMQHPHREVDKHCWYMFPIWRNNMTRDQFRSWKWCNCISLVLYPSYWQPLSPANYLECRRAQYGFARLAHRQTHVPFVSQVQPLQSIKACFSKQRKKKISIIFEYKN